MPDRASVRTALAAGTATCAAGALVGTAFGAVILVTILVAAAAATIVFLRIATSHGWLARQLRRRSVEGEVAGTTVRRGDIGGSVFVAGLARPTIFCDDVLLDQLADAELRAVTLHERAHQVARDPLRAAAVGAVAPVVGRFRHGQAWLERRAAHREIAADRYALAQGADRRAIARALLKIPPATTAHSAAFAPAADLRLRALLGDDVDTAPSRSRRALVIGAVTGTAVCLAMLHPAAQLIDALAACCPS